MSGHLFCVVITRGTWRPFFAFSFSGYVLLLTGVRPNTEDAASGQRRDPSGAAVPGRRTRDASGGSVLLTAPWLPSSSLFWVVAAWHHHGRRVWNKINTTPALFVSAVKQNLSFKRHCYVHFPYLTGTGVAVVVWSSETATVPEVFPLRGAIVQIKP